MGFRGGARFEWIGLGAGGWSLLGRILRVNHICLICQITCDNVEKLFSCDVPRAFVQRGYKEGRGLPNRSSSVPFHWAVIEGAIIWR